MANDLPATTISSPPTDEITAWHTLSADETTERLSVDPNYGLPADEIERRSELYGANELAEHHTRGLLRTFLDQFTGFMIVVLIVAAIVSGVIGEALDALAIMVIVILNGVIGFIQEYRAKRAISALKQLAAPDARVRRDGRLLTILSSELVPGDLVLVEAGNLVPCDLRVVEAIQLKVDEAALTGESVPVEKQTGALSSDELVLGDRLNMTYKGTLITYGRGSGIVVATGMNTELGKIASLLRGDETLKTPLQRRLTIFGQRLALAVLAICAVVFVAGLLRGEPPVLMFLTAVTLAVAAIPEALPAVVTISLALGARKLVKKNALIRRLPAVETLGSVTYICSDKTGTLTQNKMRVEQVYVNGRLEKKFRDTVHNQPPGDFLFRALALNNDTARNERDEVIGDPTEIALYSAACDVGYDKALLELDWPRIEEIPFDSGRKCMTTLHRNASQIISFTKGAPEQVVTVCDEALNEAGITSISRDLILNQAEQMAAAGLRVLAFAFRSWSKPPADFSPATVERGLTFLGLVGMLDPPREEVRDAITLCKSAGIQSVMITGDHPATAKAIALNLGIITDGDSTVTGQELDQLSAQELERQVKEIRVYARVAPEQKIRIVKALQDQGEFVAMTGDGVNDAPALNRADIGVAMGLSGTDVAREASHMILMDDNFATIVTAVRHGRRIYDNIRKFVKYTMTSNSGEIWTIFLAPFLGLPIPLLPIQILWINLVTDGLPGLALAVEPEEQGIMERAPRPPGENIFAHGMWQDIIWIGLLMGGVCIATQAWAHGAGLAQWQTMVFTVLTLSQLGNVLALRSETQSFFQQGMWSNPLLLAAVLLTFGLQMATIYVPFMNQIFHTVPLDLEDLLLCVMLSTIVFAALEIRKWVRQRNRVQKAKLHTDPEHEHL